MKRILDFQDSILIIDPLNTIDLRITLLNSPQPMIGMCPWYDAFQLHVHVVSHHYNGYLAQLVGIHWRVN